MQLINNRVITPAGQQTKLGDLPLNAVLSPGGSHLLVSNSGAGIQSLQVVETGSSRVVLADGLLTGSGDITIGSTQDNPFPTGLSISPDGSTLYVAMYVADANSDAVSVVDGAAGSEIRRLSVAAYPGSALGTSPESVSLVGAGRNSSGLYPIHRQHDGRHPVDDRRAAGRPAGGLFGTGRP